MKDTTSLEAPARALDRAGRLSASRSLFLLAAGISFLVSVLLWFAGQREQGLFVGLWVPSILSLGSLLARGREGRP